MSKNYKYHKSYAENISFSSYVEKRSPDICLKKVVHTYIRTNFPKVENYEERNLPKKESR